MYWILFIGITIASWLVQANLKRKFKNYSQIPLPSGMTGVDVAGKMLREKRHQRCRSYFHTGNADRPF